MKKLTKSEMESIQEQMRSEYFFHYRKMMESKFSLGDVLIRKFFDFTGSISEDEIELYDEDCKLPVRYLVVYVDPISELSFVKKYNDEGELNNDIVPIYNVDDYDYGDQDYSCYFEVDPAYVSAMIVGEEFDIEALFEQEKQRKQRHVDYRKNNALRFDNASDLHLFLSNLPPGHKLWAQEIIENPEEWSWEDIDDYWAIENQSIKSIQSSKPRGSKKVTSKKKQVKNELTEYTYVTSDNMDYSSRELLNFVFYLSKPPEISSDI